MRRTRSTGAPVTTDCLSAGKTGVPILTYELTADQWVWSGPCVEKHHSKFGDLLAGHMMQVWQEVAERSSQRGAVPVRFAWYETQKGSFLVVNVNGGERAEYPTIRGVHVYILPGGEPAPVGRFGVSLPVAAAAHIVGAAPRTPIMPRSMPGKRAKTRANPKVENLPIISYNRDPKTGEWKWGGLLYDRNALDAADNLARRLFPVLSELAASHLTPEETANLSGWEAVGSFEWDDTIGVPSFVWQRQLINIFVDLEGFQTRILKRLETGAAAGFTVTIRRRLESVEVPKPQPKPDPVEEFFGPPISTYSRAQAIEDGVLADLSEIAPDVTRQHYKHPIAATAAVWAIIEKAATNKRTKEVEVSSVKGIVHDMLWMSRTYKRQIDRSTVMFRVKIVGAGRQKLYDFKLVVGPGDKAEPVITIMLPNED